ncbi:hypothetical protein L1D24_00730 [Vibrio brasiliensis]|uniref:hypothetical protein n=1 Tax=Vibrio brasiliensis TaxID=170652 RepID=UPI001EFE4DDE|nr:hypothetical protein [Vibrio brasiliensis]MCG9647085.1 hypothetical protein [Vibrio brasiliensis]
MRVVERNQKKVLETEKLLKEIITSPNDFKDDVDLIGALRSQSAIAKYENQDRDITACSLNTLKSNSEALLERGFQALDELRINAKEKIENAHNEEGAIRGNKQTAAGLRVKVAELESELDAVQRSNFLLTVMVSELRSKLKQLAMHEGTTEERQDLYREHNRKVEAELNYTLNGEV